MNSKNTLIITGILLLLVTIAGGVYFYKIGSSEETSRSDNPEQNIEQQTQTEETTSQSNDASRFAFETPKKSAHYESNAPAHGAILAGVPINVVIDFNFDLATGSEIAITKDGVNYHTDETMIDNNKLAMRRAMSLEADNGLYTVSYNACWPDGSCHQGNFQFAIDKDLAAEYKEMTSQNEITVEMKDILFIPQNIKISKGATVTWVNNDSVSHYVNTDSHPAHTYHKDHNSREIKPGESYSYTFETAGLYPYHCSAHAETMVGNILVQ